MEKQLFFGGGATAGLGLYCPGGYVQIGVYRLNVHHTTNKYTLLPSGIEQHEVLMFRSI